MKRRELIQNGIVLPIVAALILLVVFFLFFKGNVARFVPVSPGTEIAYHDSLTEPDGNLAEPVKNQNLGTLTWNDVSLNLYYDADYSYLKKGMAVMPSGSNLKNAGCTYLKTACANAAGLEKGSVVCVTVDGEERFYGCYDTKNFNSEYELLQLSPKGERSLVIYCQASDGAGLKSGYNALIFKEVAHGS